MQMYYLNVNPICTEESNINKEHLISFYSGSGSAAIQLIESSLHQLDHLLIFLLLLLPLDNMLSIQRIIELFHF